MRTCPDCGCRVYSLGCVNCNEEAYIEQQAGFDELYGLEDGPRTREDIDGTILNVVPKPTAPQEPD